MASSSVTIDRSSLSKSALTIGDDPDGTYVLTEKGLGRPGITARAVTVTAPWVHGDVTTSVVRDTATLPLEVLIQANDAAGLEAATADLDEALWQFNYATTVAEGATSRVWSCSPASYGLTDTVNVSNVAEFFEVWTITIPVYPVSA